MPRKAFISPTIMLDVLQKFEIFDENLKLKCRSDQVWKDASTQISDKLLPNTLNSYVRNNRWNLLTDVKKHFNIPFQEENVIDSINTTSEGDVTEEFETHNVTKNITSKLPNIYFDLTLSDDQWKSIYPVSKVYKEKGRLGKTYKILNAGWTDVISEASFLKHNFHARIRLNIVKCMTFRKQKHI